jgi:hypothetical protein
MFLFLFISNIIGSILAQWLLYISFKAVLTFFSLNYEYKGNWCDHVAEWLLFLPLSYLILVPIFVFFYKDFLKSQMLITFGVPWVIPLATLSFLIISFFVNENLKSQQVKQAIVDNIHLDQAAKGLKGDLPNIHIAIEGGIEQVKSAIHAGADINYVWNDRTVLYGAIQSNNWKVATFLLELGADADFRPTGGLRHDTAAELFCAYLSGAENIKKVEINPGDINVIQNLISAFEKRGVVLTCINEINKFK